MSESEPLAADLGHWISEMRIALTNFTKSFNHAESLDPQSDSPTTRQLLYTLSAYATEIIKEAEEYLKDLNGDDDLKGKIIKEITDIRGRTNAMIVKVGQKATHWDHAPDCSKPMSSTVLLLKLAQEKGKINLSEDQQQSDTTETWGRLASFNKYIGTLSFKPHQYKSFQYHPGIPNCISALIPDSLSDVIIISATSEKIMRSKALGGACALRRKDLLRGFEHKCSIPMQTQINRFGRISAELIKAIDGERQSEQDIRKKADQFFTANHGHELPVTLPGLFASWNSGGLYLPACLTDHFRFVLNYPPYPRKREDEKLLNDRRCNSRNSCAEWACFVECASLEIM